MSEWSEDPFGPSPEELIKQERIRQEQEEAAAEAATAALRNLLMSSLSARGPNTTRSRGAPAGGPSNSIASVASSSSAASSVMRNSTNFDSVNLSIGGTEDESGSSTHRRSRVGVSAVAPPVAMPGASGNIPKPELQHHQHPSSSHERTPTPPGTMSNSNSASTSVQASPHKSAPPIVGFHTLMPPRANSAESVLTPSAGMSPAPLYHHSTSSYQRKMSASPGPIARGNASLTARGVSPLRLSALGQQQQLQQQPRQRPSSARGLDPARSPSSGAETSVPRLLFSAVSDAPQQKNPSQQQRRTSSSESGDSSTNGNHRDAGVGAGGFFTNRSGISVVASSDASRRVSVFQRPSSVQSPTAATLSGSHNNNNNSSIASRVTNANSNSGDGSVVATINNQVVAQHINDIVCANIISVEKSQDNSDPSKKLITFFELCTTTVAQQQNPLLTAWTSVRRFSEFERLHQQLTDIFGGSSISFTSKAALPSKFQLGSKQSDDFIAKRRAGLEQYLGAVIKYIKHLVASGVKSSKLHHDFALELLCAFLGGPAMKKSLQHQQQAGSASSAAAAATSSAKVSRVASTAEDLDNEDDDDDDDGFVRISVSGSTKKPSITMRAPPHQLWRGPLVFSCILGFASPLIAIGVSPTSMKPHQSQQHSSYASAVSSTEMMNASAAGATMTTVYVQGRSVLRDAEEGSVVDLRTPDDEETVMQYLLKDATGAAALEEQQHQPGQQQQQQAMMMLMAALEFEIAVQIPNGFDPMHPKITHNPPGVPGTVVLTWRKEK